MSEWPMVPLGAVLRKSEDWIPLRPDQSYQEVTVRLWGKGVTLRRQVLGAEIASNQRLRVRPQQFIISKIDARNGASGIVPNDLDEAVVSSDFPVYSADSTRLLPEYMGWLSKTKAFVAICTAASEGTTNRVRLKESRFLAQTIPLPSINEQQRIVKYIDDLAAKIEEARLLREEAALEADALLKSTMRRTFQQIPESTEVSLESVCAAIIDCLHSNPIYSATGIPTLRSPDIGWGTLALETALRTDADEYSRRTVRGAPQPGDIVVVREGGGTGKAGMTEPGHEFSLGQRVMLLRPDASKVEPRFLLYQWLSPLVLEDQIYSRMKGSASPHLNIGATRQFRLRVPSHAVQKEIVSYLDVVRARLNMLSDNQRNVSQELSTLLPAILSNALDGKI